MLLQGGQAVPVCEHQSTLNLRRCILEHLYARFRAYPRAPVELVHLAEVCSVSARELNWNMVYLEKKGWIKLDQSADCPPYAACSAELTGAGIDLVEDHPAMDGLFQPRP